MAAVRDIGHAKGYRRLPCPTSSLSDSALRGHHGIPLRRGTPSRDERSLRHGNVASPTTNLPTTGPSTMDPATTRHTPANTVRCNDLLSANPCRG